MKRARKSIPFYNILLPNQKSYPDVYNSRTLYLQSLPEGWFSWCPQTLWTNEWQSSGCYVSLDVYYVWAICACISSAKPHDSRWDSILQVRLLRLGWLWQNFGKTIDFINPDLYGADSRLSYKEEWCHVTLKGHQMTLHIWVWSDYGRLFICVLFLSLALFFFLLRPEWKMSLHFLCKPYE